MKIAVITTPHLPGGCDLYADRMVSYLARQHEVSLFEKKERIPRRSVHLVKTWSPSSLRSSIEEMNPDAALIVLAWPADLPLVLPAVTELGKRAVFVFQIYPAQIAPPYVKPDPDMLSRAAKNHTLVSVSLSGRDHLAHALNLPAASLPLIRNGADLPTSDESRAKDRERFGLRDDETMVLTLARAVTGKGFDMLLRGASTLRHLLPRHRFMWAGPSGGSPFNPLWSESNFRYFGEVKPPLVGSLLRAADVFLLMTVQEGFSFALVEAMQASLPLLATSVDGNVECLVPGVNGQFVEFGRLDTLIKGLTTLKPGMGEQSKARADELELSFESMSSKTLALLGG